MEATLQAITLRFRRPARRLVAAVALACALGAIVAAGAAIRRATVPEPATYTPLPLPPPECPGDPGCGFSPLARAPSLGEVYVARSRRAGEAPPPRPLPPGWEGVRDPADRAFLEVAIEEVARNVPPGTPVPDEMALGVQLTLVEVAAGLVDSGELARLGPDVDAALVAARYRSLREAAWRTTVDLRRRDVVDTNERNRRAAHDAAAAHGRALDAASWPRGWEWALLATGALLVGAAAVHRRVAYHPVRLDAHAIRAGSRRWLWEDLAEVTWLPDRVELVQRDGGTVRLESVDLVEHELQSLYALSDRLLAGRDDASAADEGRERLAALVGRVR